MCGRAPNDLRGVFCLHASTHRHIHTRVPGVDSVSAELFLFAQHVGQVCDAEGAVPVLQRLAVGGTHGIAVSPRPGFHPLEELGVVDRNSVVRERVLRLV